MLHLRLPEDPQIPRPGPRYHIANGLNQTYKLIQLPTLGVARAMGILEDLRSDRYPAFQLTGSPEALHRRVVCHPDSKRRRNKLQRTPLVKHCHHQFPSLAAVLGPPSPLSGVLVVPGQPAEHEAINAWQSPVLDGAPGPGHRGPPCSIPSHRPHFLDVGHASSGDRGEGGRRGLTPTSVAFPLSASNIQASPLSDICRNRTRITSVPPLWVSPIVAQPSINTLIQ